MYFNNAGFCQKTKTKEQERQIIVVNDISSDVISFMTSDV